MDMSSGGRITDAGARTGHSHTAEEADALAASAIQDAGDILVGTGPGAYERVAVGADGTSLTAASGQPAGVTWSAVAPAVHTHTQTQSHNSPDTDTSTAALHHTLGTGANQAAAGNHTHSDIVPVGAIMPYAGVSAPAGWLICDGSVKSQATYPALYAVCSTLYADPANPTPEGFFRLPNLQGRAPFGFTSGSADFNAVGKSGGSATASITTNHMPSHTHTTPSHQHTTQSHNHTITSHTHSTPNHDHTLTLGDPGNHKHSVSVTINADSGHQHDSRVNNVSGVRGTSAGNVGVFAGTNTTNLVAAGGSHGHTNSVSETNAGGHTHTQTWTSSGSGVTGYGQDTLASTSVVIDTSGSGVSGSAGTGSPLPTMNPYLAVNFIIKAS